MALLTKQAIVRAGIVPSYGAAAGGGDEFVPDSNTYLHVKNGGGSSINVTIVTPKDVGGEAIADRVVAVANGSEKVIGPFPANLFANPTDGKADITYSGVTSVTIGCFSLSE